MHWEKSPRGPLHVLRPIARPELSDILLILLRRRQYELPWHGFVH
ncbi:hypothetical protein EVA_02342 [gut metagenome]|uniref:Uncharacterized protein n=1 Tax=gut metagenome TaxID=749906 RepID=J9H688_9ZZZZ